MELPINYETAHWTTRKKAREQYIKNQEGLCYHCGSSLKGDASDEMKKLPIKKELFPVGFFDWPVHLHHSHETGLTVGAVHSFCNAILWQYHGE